MGALLAVSLAVVGLAALAVSQAAAQAEWGPKEDAAVSMVDLLEARAVVGRAQEEDQMAMRGGWVAAVMPGE